MFYIASLDRFGQTIEEVGQTEAEARKKAIKHYNTVYKRTYGYNPNGHAIKQRNADIVIIKYCRQHTNWRGEKQ